MVAKNKTLLVITGPTASGKTSLAIKLAQHLSTSIVSADSRQCYQGMAIGTAQPSPEELASVRHYFVDEFPPSETLNAAAFERLALGYLDEIFARSDWAIACGGTGLYIRALCEGLDEMPEIDEEVASAVDAAYRQHGIGWLQDALRIEDPSFESSSEWENPARLIRALTFVRSTGQSILSFRSGTVKERPFKIIKIALDLPREILYQRINERVDQMMEAGLLDEVKSLIPYRDKPALQTVGYAELFDYLDGRCSLDAAIDKIKQHTRNYAKRQLTWLRKDKDVLWFRADSPFLMQEILRHLI